MSPLHAYRTLLRSIHLAFANDTQTLSAALLRARHEFSTPSSSPVEDNIAHAYNVAKFLRSNIVQGEKVEGDGEKWKLNIHKDTERGDNDSVKVPKVVKREKEETPFAGRVGRIKR